MADAPPPVLWSPDGVECAANAIHNASAVLALREEEQNELAVQQEKLEASLKLQTAEILARADAAADQFLLINMVKSKILWNEMRRKYEILKKA